MRRGVVGHDWLSVSVGSALVSGGVDGGRMLPDEIC